MISDLRIGSRSSPMALAQAGRVCDLLSGRVAHPEIVGIRTSGDRWAGDLAEFGGKGGFLKEVDRALVEGGVDVAVHCLKDVPGDVPPPDGTTFAAYLERDDVRDVLVSRGGALDDLPAGARVGTSSVRRAAHLHRLRPDLTLEKIRGNVDLRLAQLDEGRYDALVVALAGLRRIGSESRATQVLPVDVMCPAVGAGVIGVRCRTADRDVVELLRGLDHAETRTQVVAERAMLRRLRGRCNSPIAGHSVLGDGDELTLTGMVFTTDGGRFVHARMTGTADRPAELGESVAAELVRHGARQVIDGEHPRTR